MSATSAWRDSVFAAAGNFSASRNHYKKKTIWTDTEPDGRKTKCEVHKEWTSCRRADKVEFVYITQLYYKTHGQLPLRLFQVHDTQLCTQSNSIFRLNTCLFIGHDLTLLRIVHVDLDSTKVGWGGEICVCKHSQWSCADCALVWHTHLTSLQFVISSGERRQSISLRIWWCLLLGVNFTFFLWQTVVWHSEHANICTGTSAAVSQTWEVLTHHKSWAAER